MGPTSRPEGFGFFSLNSSASLPPSKHHNTKPPTIPHQHKTARRGRGPNGGKWPSQGTKKKKNLRQGLFLFAQKVMGPCKVWERGLQRAGTQTGVMTCSVRHYWLQPLTSGGSSGSES
ncbi:hypothetical protein J3F84DRAFT_375026 [Trichoderma pleuroticola]